MFKKFRPVVSGFEKVGAKAKDLLHDESVSFGNSNVKVRIIEGTIRNGQLDQTIYLGGQVINLRKLGIQGVQLEIGEWNRVLKEGDKITGIFQIYLDSDKPHLKLVAAKRWDGFSWETVMPPKKEIFLPPSPSLEEEV